MDHLRIRYDIRFRISAQSKTYELFLEKIDTKNIDYKLARRGDIIKLGRNEFKVLNPEEPLQNANNSSIVFKTEHKDIGFLINLLPRRILLSLRPFGLGFFLLTGEYAVFYHLSKSFFYTINYTLPEYP
jgi:hypothetical protein